MISHNQRKYETKKLGILVKLFNLSLLFSGIFGVKFKQVAQLLLTDNISRNDVALNKYGENHIKMASSIGLVFKANDIYYLSPIGCLFDELDDEVREKLLLRLILRNKLIRQLLLEASNKTFNMEAFLYDLSESTYKRRRTNIKYVIGLINNTSEYNFLSITYNIKY